METKNYVDLVQAGAMFAKPGKPRLVMGGMGLCGEAGEVSELLKKYLFHGQGLDEDRLREELGDVLWYIALLAGEVHATIKGLATQNMAKLYDRHPDRYPDILQGTQALEL